MGELTLMLHVGEAEEMNGVALLSSSLSSQLSLVEKKAVGTMFVTNCTLAEPSLKEC